MNNFKFSESDQKGLDTLKVISEAQQFNRWMYQTIKPFCKGDILEIGSGIGNISSFFINEKFVISLSDIRKNYCDILKEKFTASPNVKGVVEIDLVDNQFEDTYRQYIESYDTVFALNVVEHISNDHCAIKNCRNLLKANGHIIILVPAYQKLYNRLDIELEHYRRYTCSSLQDIIHKNGFEIIHKQYFNFMGIFGWFISGSLQKNQTIPKNQMNLYNSMVPIFKIIDKILLNNIGLSAIVVGRKI